jgi:hypothetical protein
MLVVIAVSSSARDQANLLADPASARPSHVGSFSLCRLQAFF